MCIFQLYHKSHHHSKQQTKVNQLPTLSKKTLPTIPNLTAPPKLATYFELHNLSKDCQYSHFETTIDFSPQQTPTQKIAQRHAPTKPNLSPQQHTQLHDIHNVNLAPTVRKRLKILDIAPQPPPQGIFIESKDQISNSNTNKKMVSIYMETPKRFKLATNPSIRKQNINRLMDQIMRAEIGDTVTNINSKRISAEARQSLHIGTEDHLIEKLQAANEYVAHDNRVTVKLKDLKLVEKLFNARRTY